MQRCMIISALETALAKFHQRPIPKKYPIECDTPNVKRSYIFDQREKNTEYEALYKSTKSLKNTYNNQ